jgi:hypothetical protein
VSAALGRGEGGRGRWDSTRLSSTPSKGTPQLPAHLQLVDAVLVALRLAPRKDRRVLQRLGRLPVVNVADRLPRGEGPVEGRSGARDGRRSLANISRRGSANLEQEELVACAATPRKLLPGAAHSRTSGRYWNSLHLSQCSGDGQRGTGCRGSAVGW